MATRRTQAGEPFTRHPAGVNNESEYWAILENAAEMELERLPHQRDSSNYVAENLILNETFNVRNVLTYTRNLYAYEEQVLDEIPVDETLEWIAIWALGSDIEAYTLHLERSGGLASEIMFDDRDED